MTTAIRARRRTLLENSSQGLKSTAPLLPSVEPLTASVPHPEIIAEGFLSMPAAVVWLYAPDYYKTLVSLEMRYKTRLDLMLSACGEMMMRLCPRFSGGKASALSTPQPG